MNGATTIQERLKDLRLNKGLKLEELAEQTLSRFAKNGRKKSSKSFSDLLLHVPLWGSGYSVVK